ncbi:MAG: hypothetical protein KC416_10605 [Myxococcales bacterium]|nr:hypothetical protein [Myxococcales bacterium]
MKDRARFGLGVGLVPFLLGVAALSVGCEAPGVGDPCDPENVPAGGFVSREAYLETSSVQCRTRVCMVYKLQGDTDKVIGEHPDCPLDGTMDDDCVAGPGSGCDPSQATCVPARVYCTCRCDAPAGSSTSTCECPDGYSCEPVLQLGGAGIRGSYCVKKSTLGDEES